MAGGTLTLHIFRKVNQTAGKAALIITVVEVPIC